MIFFPYLYKQFISQTSHFQILQINFKTLITNILTTSAVQHRNRFPTEVEESLSLEVFRTQINKSQLSLVFGDSPASSTRMNYRGLFQPTVP